MLSKEKINKLADSILSEQLPGLYLIVKKAVEKEMDTEDKKLSSTLKFQISIYIRAAIGKSLAKRELELLKILKKSQATLPDALPKYVDELCKGYYQKNVYLDDKEKCPYLSIDTNIGKCSKYKYSNLSCAITGNPVNFTNGRITPKLKSPVTFFYRCSDCKKEFKK